MQTLRIPSPCLQRGQPPPALQPGCDAEMLVPFPRPRTRVQPLPSPQGEVQPTAPRVLIPSPSTKGPYPPRRRHRSHRQGPGRGGGDPSLRVPAPPGRSGGSAWFRPWSGTGSAAETGDATGRAGPGTGRRCHHRGSGAPGGAHARGRGRGVRGELVGLSRGRRGRAGDGGGAAPRATFRRAEGPRRPRRRWYRMQIRRLTSEIMWGLA